MVGGLKFMLPLSPFFAAIAGPGHLAYGQDSLPDPTRPPVIIEAAPATPEVVPLSGGLQTIILRKGKKSMAVINGVTVAIGDKVGDATLVKLTESEAILQGPAGRDVMYLTPGVEKKGSLPLKPSSGAEKGDKRTHKQAPAQPDQRQ